MENKIFKRSNTGVELLPHTPKISREIKAERKDAIAGNIIESEKLILNLNFYMQLSLKEH